VTIPRNLWTETAPPAPETPVLRDSIRADVAVVGAGFTGLSAALHLAERGARVAVLEAEGIGHGAAGRNVGFVNSGMWVPPDYLAEVLGPHVGERLLALLGEAPPFVFDLIARHGIDCEPRRVGTLQCATGWRGLKLIRERAAQWLRRGADVELLDAQATARMVGSAFYDAALLDRRTGTVQPLAYARGLATAALRAGARVYTESPALRTHEEAGAWRLECPTGSVLADWIVLATDAYGIGAWPAVERELIHLPYFNVATRPLPPSVAATILPGGQGLGDAAVVISSVRLDPSGRLIFGSVGAMSGMGGGIHRAWAERAARRIFPQIGAAEFEYAWDGSIGLTDTRLPKFHRPAPRVLSVSGYNGRGIAAGTLFGRLLAQLVVGEIAEEELPLPVTAFGEPAFRSLQSAFYEWGARAAHWTGARF
jgi:glycine/D-amino acid oxidase-like deaminating enzyme